MADLPRFFGGFSDWRNKAEQNLTACLKVLLETKHLYQSATVDLNIRPRNKEDRQWKLKAAREKWDIHDNAISPSASHSEGYYFTVTVPDVKLFCHQCDRVEAFNSISSQAVTGRSVKERDGKATSDAIQVFALS